MRSRAPIKNTCPTIDKYINSIKSCIYQQRELQGMDKEDLFEAACNMSYELSCCIYYLEDMRESNDALRTWGEEEASMVDEQEERITSLEEEIEELRCAT